MNPIAFHFNGKSFNKYSKQELAVIYNYLYNNSSDNDQSDYELFTFDNTYCSQRNEVSNPMLIDCCRKLNLQYVNLGEDIYLSKIKSNYPADLRPRQHLVFQGWKRTDYFPLVKVLSLYHYLKDNPNFKKKYLLMLDQADLLLVDNPRHKIELFKSKKCGMIFAAESKCMYFAMRVRQSEHYADTNKYFANYTDVKDFETKIYSQDCYTSNGVKMLYLNGGAMMCEKDYFISLVEKYLGFIVEFMNLNEQTVMHHLHFMYYPEILVDNKCEMFQCMGPKKVEVKL